MIKPNAHPNKLSPTEFERLLSNVESLTDMYVPGDSEYFGQLISNEHRNLPELFAERKFAPGEVVFQENDQGDTMHIIQSGRVAVLKGDFLAPTVLGCRSSGETIGEMALLEAKPRSASVVALEPLRLLEISRDNFQKLLGASPTFSQGIMQMLSARLRESSKAVRHETLDKIRDSLTGLYNRRYMEETLRQELLRATRADYPVSLIMLDMDHFKRLNDTFGHPAGDQVLRSLGELLLSQVRGEDVACRYGGEEFLLILPGTSLETASRRAEELRLAFEAIRVYYGSQILECTLSLGVATFPDHGLTPEQILQATDVALYAAKIAGRNRVMTAT